MALVVFLLHIGTPKFHLSFIAVILLEHISPTPDLSVGFPGGLNGWFYRHLLFSHVTGAVCLDTQSYPSLCNPVNYSLLGSSVHRDSPGKNTGVGSHALLQGIFPTQGSNPGLLHCRRILYNLRHQRSPMQWGCLVITGMPV